MCNAGGINFSFKHLMIGIVADYQFYSVILCVLFPLFLIIYKIQKSIAIWIISFSLVLFFVFQILLALYFYESLTPLTYGNLNGMSNTQILFILDVYEFDFYNLLYIILLIIILLVLFVRSIDWLDRKIFRISAVILLLVSLLGFAFIPIVPNKFVNQQGYELAQNKTYYFSLSYFEFRQNEINSQNADFKSELKVFYSLNGLGNKVSYNYPFYLDKEVRNPLGPFFPKNEKPPNVVFIISESLGKLFSGKNARLGSFTPFLDSLAESSLYWENIIANAERTFGAIPNFMAGVPDGKEGFLNLKSSMPDHFSLPLLLKVNNNYQTNFYCGAWKKFDNMSDYLAFQRFDNINGKSDFLKYTGADKSKEFNWGVEDRTVFNESFKMMDDKNSSKKPYFNLYLTTSFHKPFSYNSKAYFLKLARKKVNQLKLVNQGEHLSQIETFAALLYADDCLRNFFELYKERDDFENTIFVISGDHSVKFMSNDSRLEKYHVPLLIYSPKLLRVKHFKSVGCQKDVPSSLQGLLLNNYNLKLPINPISMSDNLDTLSSFSAKGNNFAMMYADKTINNYVFDNYFYSNGILFKIQDDMSLDRIEDETVLKEIENKIENYRFLSRYVCENNYAVPKDNYNSFVK
jgi:uncharacterized sulfatase